MFFCQRYEAAKVLLVQWLLGKKVKEEDKRILSQPENCKFIYSECG